MDTQEYVIISKTAIQKRIEELEKYLPDTDFEEQRISARIDELEEILYQSIPLIPEIEKAFDEGFNSEEEVYKGNPTGKIIGKQEYIVNLKIDI